jgi:hypothetical protein
MEKRSAASPCLSEGAAAISTKSGTCLKGLVSNDTWMEDVSPITDFRNAIETELYDIEAILADDKLTDEDRAALHGAQQTLRNVLDPATWHPASQTFYRVGACPIEAASTSVN